jgi:hypothetical protein
MAETAGGIAREVVADVAAKVKRRRLRGLSIPVDEHVYELVSSRRGLS